MGRMIGMEARFGHDFSQVRVHSNEESAVTARAHGALAYTTGSDVVFGPGQCRPDTAAGRWLLAHELAHVANPWGLPGQLDGPVASHVLALGDEAVPAFAVLLDDGKPLRYRGSKEAAYGNSYNYRVKDEAAALIAKLIGVPYPVHLNPQDRNAQTDLLRQLLP